MMRRPSIRLINLHPTYARGLADYLNDAGYLDVDLTSQSDFERKPIDCALIIGVADRTDTDRLAGTSPNLKIGPIIALVVDESPLLLVESLKSGAHSSLPITASPAAVILALEAAQLDQSTIPTYVANRIANSSHWPPPARRLDDDQMRWIKRLAHGETVIQIAADEGYSRRSMFLMLRGVYRDLGVKNRTEAIIKLAREGFL